MMWLGGFLFISVYPVIHYCQFTDPYLNNSLTASFAATSAARTSFAAATSAARTFLFRMGSPLRAFELDPSGYSWIAARFAIGSDYATLLQVCRSRSRNLRLVRELTD